VPGPTARGPRRLRPLKVGTRRRCQDYTDYDLSSRCPLRVGGCLGLATLRPIRGGILPGAFPKLPLWLLAILPKEKAGSRHVIEGEIWWCGAVGFSWGLLPNQ